jgi:hypothetical protein
MKKLRLGPPSPAMVVAVIALVVAMAGTGYAALKLPKNSVGTKQVKKNAITTAKIKKDAVTGAKVKAGSLAGTDIDLNSLGTVPSANTANTANSLAAAEPIHFVGTPGEPVFENGSQTQPSPVPGLSFGKVGFYKDRAGFVHLEGIALAGEGVTVGGVVPIFTLPPGFRPESGVTQIFGSENGAAIFGSNVTAEGKVVGGAVAGAKKQPAVLNGIVYRPGS